jgi:PPE-repeat protein
MAAAAAPYVVWLMACAAQCQQAGVAATANALAYETARIGHAHPSIIAANRSELVALIATNFLGVNSAAIAENEAEYQTFWSADAAAMYGYAATAAGNLAAMIPSVPAGPTADPAGVAAQAAAGAGDAGQSAGQTSAAVGNAMGQMSGMGSQLGQVGSLMNTGSQAAGAIPQALQQMANPTQYNGQHAQGFDMRSLGNMIAGVVPGMAGSFGSLPSLSSGLGAGGVGVGPGVMASMGRATTLTGFGPRMSVPSTWAEAVKTEPTVKLVSAEEADTMAAAPRAGVGGVGSAGMMPAAGGSNSGGYAAAVGYPDNRRPRQLGSKWKEMVF